jgi:hypothetical protein
LLYPVSAGSAPSNAAVICSAGLSPPHTPANLPAADGSTPIRSSAAQGLHDSRWLLLVPDEVKDRDE